MFAGFGAAEDTNARFRQLLDAGQTGLSIAYDMPTLYGYDTDDPEAEGEFGTCGVAVSSLADMEVLLDGLPLDRISTSMTINSPAAPIWAMYIAAAEKRGVPRAALEGTIQNDILKEFVAQKEFLFPPEPSIRLVTDTIEFGTREMPRWNTISISGYHIREAGSTAVQELAFTIADGMAYTEAAIARGLRVDDFAPRLSFFFNSHNDFFEEIAKFRAARRIWWKLMTERYRAENERSTWMRFHTQTAGVSLTAQQPLNNLTRVAIQALAAVLGGTQSLHTDAYDEAWAVPSAEAALLALRQQQIIAEETGVANTVDPLGGSWFVEALTERDRGAPSGATSTRSTGGAGWSRRSPRAIPQREIADAAYRFQRELDAGERGIVGVNRHADPDEVLAIPLLQVSEASLADPARPARADPAGARRRGRRGGPGPPARPGRATRLVRDEPDAGAHRVCRRLRHARRDLRGLPGRLRRVPRAGRGLIEAGARVEPTCRAERPGEGRRRRQRDSPPSPSRAAAIDAGSSATRPPTMTVRGGSTDRAARAAATVATTVSARPGSDAPTATRTASLLPMNRARSSAGTSAPRFATVQPASWSTWSRQTRPIMWCSPATPARTASGPTRPSGPRSGRTRSSARSRVWLARCSSATDQRPFTQRVADDPHRLADDPVVDLGARSLGHGVADHPGGQLVVAVDEQSRQELR